MARRPSILELELSRARAAYEAEVRSLASGYAALAASLAPGAASVPSYGDADGLAAAAARCASRLSALRALELAASCAEADAG